MAVMRRRRLDTDRVQAESEDWFWFGAVLALLDTFGIFNKN